MKFILSFFMFISMSAFAADIIVEIGGVRHLCTPIATGNPTQCYDVAYRGPFSRDESMELCAGSFSDAPAQCAILAYRGRFSKVDSINLCIGSTTNTGPVDCANRAYSGPFSAAESLDLCSRNATERNATCAIQAYSGPYTKEQSIAMCKNPRFADDKSLMSERIPSKEEFNTMLDEANAKAILLKEYK